MKKKSEWKEIGVVGVDSGTLMITDPCYVTGDEWSDKDYDKHVCGMNEDHAQVPFKLGHAGKGVIFSSGFGDGVYKVFAKVKNYKEWGNRIAEVKIVLIDEKG